MITKPVDPDFFKPGQVALIGAGPGDPELLTIKAVKYLGAAEVILVDDLVNSEVLKYANPHARIIQVGKRGGCISTPQAFIEKMMVNEAQAGRRVVRLKGGDPLIFGRGAEELACLQDSGIQSIVINGISSGFAAANSLGASLTHRNHSSSVTFVTGHLKNPEQSPNWTALVKSRTTLVIYMGLSRARDIQEQLISAGMRLDTPVGLVSSASTTKEVRVHTDLQNMHQAIEVHRLSSPVIMLIGDVIAAARQLAQVDRAA